MTIRAFSTCAVAIACGTVALSPFGCSSSNDNPPALDNGIHDGGPIHTDGAVGAMDGSNPMDAAGDTVQMPATCMDTIKNGTETDVDCGGGTCPVCADTLHCKAPTDCMSHSCSSAGVCLAATCQDQIKNGKETDTDCGGGVCGACLVGKACTAPADCVSAICTNNACTCTGGMVTMPTALALGGAYCIDPLEVTRKEYSDFWTANPNLGNNLPAACSFKTSYTPSNDWPPTLTSTNYDGGFPIHFVDWCDAYAFCKWKGKTLCGSIDGTPVARADAADRLKDGWFNACSAQAANTYPYGSTYDANKCDGADFVTAHMADNPSPFPAGLGGDTYEDKDFGGGVTHPACQGGAPGLYQMSGNVAEWENSCDATAGMSDNCLVRGGSYASSSTDLQCATLTSATRSTRAASIGFRCCL